MDLARNNAERSARLRWGAEQRLKLGCPEPRQYAECDRQALLHELEVHRIELEIQNEELQGAVSRAEERAHNLEVALRELESFSYAVSHDLRAPLRHINSYLAILVEDFGGSLPPEAQRLMDQTRKATGQMSTLIDDLLELARVSRVKVTQSRVDLSAAASMICDTLQQTDPGRQVEFVIHRGLKARGDKTLLTQMLYNLLENAWKYTANSGKAAIEVGSHMVERKSVFYVKDNGVGFDPQYQEKLFHAFQRLHGNEFPGNGIGLATVKRIIDRHRGRVWAESSPDAGATFFFTLPA